MAFGWSGLKWGASRKTERFHHHAHFEGVLGTSLEIQVVSKLEASGPQAELAALRELDRLEPIFNAYNHQSELSRWQQTWDEAVSVSPELAQALESAENWRVFTHGAFNPAVEALTRLWKQHELDNTPVEPSEIEQIVAQMDGPLWEADPETNHTTRLTRLPVTLNAIAKGYIIDQTCLAASKIEGIEAVLINIGGDIRHFGARPTRIAVTDPLNHAENALPLDRIEICNQGLATSGNYRRGFQIGGQWYSHLIDPRTGWPVQELVGVSVIVESAASADVLATAFSVLKPNESLELADSLEGVGVLLVSQRGQRFSNEVWNKHRVGQD